MSSTPTLPVAQPTNPPHYFADLYTYDWKSLNFRLPAISASAVALCLGAGLALGHPGGALIAGGGALTIGFGANQRIGDSRLLPMIFAVLAMAGTTLVGTVVGHRGFELLIASAIAAAIYGVLTIRNSGVAWVSQQSSIALFVASAFHSGMHAAVVRAALIVAGGTVQILFTSLGLRLMPELRKDLLMIPQSLFHSMAGSLADERRELLHRLRALPQSLPAPDRRAAAIYALRLVLTVGIATEVYRRLGLQSGYWIPMTALLVQKPAFFGTLNRALLRVGGTLAGATLATLLVVHVSLTPWALAACVTFFAFWSFATNSINYGLFTVCMTSYIVFLLSLNQMPGPEIAHRRALCTITGAGIALLIHLDALRRHRAQPTSV